jgi:hypothetical protein
MTSLVSSIGIDLSEHVNDEENFDDFISYPLVSEFNLLIDAGFWLNQSSQFTFYASKFATLINSHQRHHVAPLPFRSPHRDLRYHQPRPLLYPTIYRPLNTVYKSLESNSLILVSIRRHQRTRNLHTTHHIAQLGLLQIIHARQQLPLCVLTLTTTLIQHRSPLKYKRAPLLTHHC